MSFNEKSHLPHPATSSSSSTSQKQDDGPSSSSTKRSFPWMRTLQFAVVAGILVHLSGCKIGKAPRDRFSSVDWQPCLDHPDFLCGTLDVPTDYFNTSYGTTTLALSKAPFTSHPSKRIGTLFLNPGGPGGSGRDFTFRLKWMELLKGRYDVVGFDPRGIARTTPRVDCFESAEEYALFKKSTVLSQSFNIPPNANLTWQSLLEQNKELRALKEVEFTLCAQKMGTELDYMGTSTVVRDIERMSAVLDGPDAPINFYGGSYGTIVGAYLVNMLPKKAGRVLIDGVASSPQWANVRADLMIYDWLDSTENTFAWFLRDCAAAGPEGCALALETDKDASGSEIEQRLTAYLDELYVKPVAISGGDVPGILSSGSARSRLYASTNAPHSWELVAQLFAEAMYNSNPLPLHTATRAGAGGLPVGNPAPDGYVPSGQSDLSRAAVGCADGPSAGNRSDGPTAEEMSKEMVRVIQEKSIHFGGSVAIIEPDGGCEFWPRGEHPEGFRFSGPWNATLRTPMMIISNTADPITPLSSGHEINNLMGNSSRLLIQNSPGHCSSGSTSICTLKAIQAYLLEGELPEDESRCEINDTFFPSPVNKANLLEVEQAMSSEETELLRIGRESAVGWTNLLMGW
ncbi:TAP-like protein-domain-containing protein [Mrakia frigida]|uniref:TAP-like protein-domain-containing protein n=1 Tax=Mrakia frigida TaxID=29902 RepID=UPI003FCC21F7